MRRVVALIFIVLVAAVAVLWLRKDTARWKVTEIANPATPGSQAPNLSTAPDGSLILTWIELSGTDKAVRFSLWKNGTWTDPSTVIQSADLQADAAAPPNVVKLPNGTLVAVWSQWVKSPGKANGNFLFASVSGDAAKSWSRPVRIHSDVGISEHSYESIAATAPDEAKIIWLDSHDWDAKHTYRLMSVTVNAHGDLGAEKTVDADTCTCCPTAFVSTPSLSLAAYRGHTAQQIRDMKVSRLLAGNWSNPVTVHDDLWKINACPVNGPALSINGNRVAVLWFTGANDTPQVKIARSDDSGSTFQPPVLLDSPNGENQPIGHVAVSLLDDGSALAIWLRHVASGDEIVGERISSTGKLSDMFTVGGKTNSDLGYPRVQRVGSEAMISWSDKTSHSVKTAIVYLTNN